MVGRRIIKGLINRIRRLNCKHETVYAQTYLESHYTRTKREEKDDVKFVKPKDVSKQPKCIYCDDNYDVENNIYNYNNYFFSD